MDIRGLGYIGLHATDPDAWLNFGTRVCGLMPARLCPGPDGALEKSGDGRASDGTVRLKLDDRLWRLAVHPAKADGLAYLGLELATPDALREAGAELEDAGHEVSEGGAETAAARGVGALLEVDDPDGNRLELFAQPQRDGEFVSPAGAEFVTGNLGLGHIVLMSRDVDASLAFYLDVLGFRRSDLFRFAPGAAGHFLHCNQRHHSLAVFPSPGEPGAHHMMLEMTQLDHVGRALDRAMRDEVPITASLGRHKNDQNVSFYMRSPSGIQLEIGWGGRTVGDDWVENEFCDGDTWGHHGPLMQPPDAAAD